MDVPVIRASQMGKQMQQKSVRQLGSLTTDHVTKHIVSENIENPSNHVSGTHRQHFFTRLQKETISVCKCFINKPDSAESTGWPALAWDLSQCVVPPLLLLLRLSVLLSYFFKVP